MATNVENVGRASAPRSNTLARLTTETKQAFKTTEFWAMVALIVGILVASQVIGQGDGNGNNNVDAFPAVRAWLYVAIVGVGYMVSRGLAKAGSREPYWSDSDDRPNR
jgi:hypothetical protein